MALKVATSQELYLYDHNVLLYPVKSVPVHLLIIYSGVYYCLILSPSTECLVLISKYSEKKCP